MLTSFAIIFLLVALNGFFVASEFALVSIRRTRVRELVAQRVRGARAVQYALDDLDTYIAGTQVGITLASLALGWIAEARLVGVFSPVFELSPVPIPLAAQHSIAVVIAFLLITFMHVVLGELIPKTLALQSPERVSLFVGKPMALCVLLFKPLIWSLNGTGAWLLRKLKLHISSTHQHIHSVDELDIIVRQSHEAGVLDDLEKHLLQRAFRFTELVASEVMVPRTDLEMLDIDSPLKESLDKICNSIHSRYPVYRESEDNVIGMIMARDVLAQMHQGNGNIVLSELMRPVLFVPESVRLDNMLNLFREHRTHTALVVDEHGALAGLVSLKDLVEELFGEIPDVLEADLPSIRKLADGRYAIRGDVALHEINSVLNLRLEDDEVDTIAGYTLKQLGRIAKVGDAVETAVGRITVSDVTQMRITQITLAPLALAEER